jgi:hypothetical protein
MCACVLGSAQPSPPRAGPPDAGLPNPTDMDFSGINEKRYMPDPHPPQLQRPFCIYFHSLFRTPETQLCSDEELQELLNVDVVFFWYLESLPATKEMTRVLTDLVKSNQELASKVPYLCQCMLCLRA